MKSELIVRGGITEECFVTKNHAADGLDCVVVTIRVAPNITHDVEANDSQHTDGEKGHTEALMTERADKPVKPPFGGGRRGSCFSFPACQPAALGDTHPRLGLGVARPSLVGNPRERLVDFMDMAGQ